MQDGMQAKTGHALVMHAAVDGLSLDLEPWSAGSADVGRNPRPQPANGCCNNHHSIAVCLTSVHDSPPLQP